MTLRLAAALIAALALSACTDADWSRSMNSVGLGDTENATPAVEVAAPIAAPAQTAQAEQSGNAFCLAVARQDAERNAFDAETQQGVFTRNYRQCLTIFGAGTPQ